MADPESCEKPKNGNGAKAWAGVCGIVALIGCVAAVNLPMSERIASLERQLAAAVTSLQGQHAATFDRIEEQIADHKGLYGHPAAHSEITGLRAAFEEVEAQFDGDRALSAEQHKTNLRRLAKLEAWQDRDGRLIIAQQERIKALELDRKRNGVD